MKNAVLSYLIRRPIEDGFFIEPKETDKMATQSVQIKSAMESKINWTQVVGVVASIATLFGFVVPPDLIPQVVAGIIGVQGVLTIVWKTWFTDTITPSSAK